MAGPLAIAALFVDNAAARAPMIAALHAGLAGVGWREGADYSFTARFANGDQARLEALAREAAADRPGAILAAGTLPAVAAHAATDSLPIVMVGVGDPVARGLIDSFERPGGNVTGSSDQSAQAARERFAFFRRALGRPARIGVLGSRRLLPVEAWTRDGEAEGLEIAFIDAGPTGADLLAAAAAAGACAGLFVVPSPAAFGVRFALADALRAAGVPVMFGWREFMDAPAPLGCGPHLTRLYTEAAPFFERIRAGESPAAIPAVRPRFGRWMRLREAGALGLALHDLEAVVDEVICN